MKFGTDSLAVFFIRGTDTVRTGIIVDDLQVDSSVAKRHLVRVYRTEDQVLGQGVDTIVDFLGTLRPFAHYSRRSTGSQAFKARLSCQFPQRHASVGPREIEQSPVWWAVDDLLQNVPGVGPIVSYTLLGELPELSTLSHKQIAALVGVAPLARDGGTLRGKRLV